MTENTVDNTGVSLDPPEQPTSMLLTDCQRETVGTFRADILAAKARVAEALREVDSAEAAYGGYLTGIVRERKLQGQWSPTTDGTQIVRTR